MHSLFCKAVGHDSLLLDCPLVDYSLRGMMLQNTLQATPVFHRRHPESNSPSSVALNSSRARGARDLFLCICEPHVMAQLHSRIGTYSRSTSALGLWGTVDACLDFLAEAKPWDSRIASGRPRPISVLSDIVSSLSAPTGRCGSRLPTPLLAPSVTAHPSPRRASEPSREAGPREPEIRRPCAHPPPQRVAALPQPLAALGLCNLHLTGDHVAPIHPNRALGSSTQHLPGIKQPGTRWKAARLVALGLLASRGLVPLFSVLVQGVALRAEPRLKLGTNTRVLIKVGLCGGNCYDLTRDARLSSKHRSQELPSKTIYMIPLTVRGLLFSSSHHRLISSSLHLLLSSSLHSNHLFIFSSSLIHIDLSHFFCT